MTAAAPHRTLPVQPAGKPAPLGVCPSDEAGALGRLPCQGHSPDLGGAWHSGGGSRAVLTGFAVGSAALRLGPNQLPWVCCATCRACAVINYLDCSACVDDAGSTFCENIATGTATDELPAQCQFGNNDVPNDKCCSSCGGLNYPFFQYYEPRYYCWCFVTWGTIESDSDSWVGVSESAAAHLPSDCAAWRLHGHGSGWQEDSPWVLLLLGLCPALPGRAGQSWPKALTASWHASCSRCHPTPAEVALTLPRQHRRRLRPHRARLRRQGVSALPPPALAACRLSAPHAA